MFNQSKFLGSLHIMNTLIGLSWQKTNGHKYTKRQVLRVAVGCVEDLNMIARSIRKKLCGLFGNQWSSLMRTESIHE